MVSVNAVPLSGSRQEAISLVKSSHKKLTLVVRRKNDPVSRPNSWYSAKLTEEELEPAKREATAAPVWPPNNETRPKDSSNRRDQDSHQQLTSQPSSLNNMERLEHPSVLYPTGHISPTKYIGSTEPFCGLGGKKDATLSCFSTGSSSPGLEASPIGWKGTSSENIFYKGLQNEGSQAAERPRYLQPTMGNGGWEGEQPSRVSVAVRPHVGPVWQVPENKKDPSPPPPPPLRSDSFAVTKVFPYSEGPIGPTKNKGRSTDKLAENSDRNGFRSYQKTTPESRHSLTPLSANDFLHRSFAADHNQKQLHTNKLFSLSSNDVRHSHHSTLPAHQRQYSDESPRYLQTRTSTPTKIQSVGSYYRSLQDLPKNAFGHKQVRHSTASVSSFTVNPKTENEGHKRYYGIASTPSTQSAELQARPGKAEGWRGKPDKPHWLNSNEPGYQSSFKTNNKSKYSLPQFQMPYSVNKEHNGHSHLGTGLHYDHKSSELSVPSPEDSTKKCEGRPNDVKKHFPAYQSINHSVSLSRHQDPWLPQEDHRISPLKTPLLHSLAQESIILTERQPATTGGKSALENSDIMATGSGKSNRRSDRYATTLRNEIQQKRAQLQKSRSAATLTCDAEEEEAEDTRAPKTSPSSGVSFSNTYKDHLKEVQAKVLQATSFQRRDLEPFGPEPLVGKTSNGRIRGRKRFPLAKRTHSFSEPDKIDKVGVEGEPQTGSFGERRKFFENKPAFSRPVLKSSHSANLSTDSAEAIKDKTPTEESKAAAPSSDPSVAHEQAPQEQQRLGTFAEYQATWNKYKKCSDVKSQGRYHSTENILDTDTEETSLCIHERSRSSPSADFYTQNVPSSWEDPPSQQSSGSSGLPCQHDHSSEPAPSAPKNEGPVPIHADHKTKAEEDSPAHATHPSVPRSLSPSAGSQDSLPTPRSHLVPETTSTSLSSSQKKFPSGAQADAASFQPLSSTDTHQQTASRSPVGTAPVGFPQLSMTSGADTSRGAARGGEETEPPRPLPSPPLSADGARTPSPQFGAQRLTDKPPAAFAQDDSPLRSENDLKLPAEMDVISAVRKVPVMIPHSDSSSEYETQLPQGRESCGGSPLPPCVSSVSATEHPSNSAGPLQSLEDAKREELARDIMGKDRTLVDILDQSGRMTTMDLMEGIFPMEDQLLEGVFQRRRASVGSRPPTSSPRSTDRREEDSMSASAAVVSLVPSSSYYNTSAPKAELLIKMKDMQDQLEEQESEDELDIDLASKKQELIFSLAEKLEVLREARHSLQDDVEDNEALGREVEATVQRLCQPNQLDKFRMFVGDLDKVVSLLLSLSGRLARVENALYSLEEEAPPEEKRTLTEKRKLLMRQHEDAKELKENLDRRERLVAGIMEAHLDAESLDDYRHFVKMKSALIIEQRKLEDKIKLGEEQLKCLLDSLPLEQRPLL